MIRHGAALGTAGALLLLGGAACGGGRKEPVPCIDEDPGRAATYASERVAIGRDPRKSDGAALEAHRSGRGLPWFAKTALFVRGNGSVVVRVPRGLSGAIRIVGWTRPPSAKTAAAVRVTSTGSCSTTWTAYPGGLLFRGRHCARLNVEGPGDTRGSVLVGLRRDCSARATD
jgi:hypothetical protein